MSGGARSAIRAALAAWVLAGCSASWQGAMPAGDALGGDSDDLDPASLALAADRTVEALQRLPSRRLRVAGRELATRDLVASARAVAAIAREETDSAALTRRLAGSCRALPAAEPARVTAYYEPLLAARRRPDASFRYPIYAKPSAAQLSALIERLGHAPTRADIDAGHVLAGLGLELAWTDDPVALFFLHIQGSGRLAFEDAAEVRVGFAASNDLAYRSVGSVMLARKILGPANATAPAMRAWLAAHPDRRDALLFENPRYIFFRETAGEGPVGALGATLVAGRSIASDDRYVPRGSLVWLRTTRPIVEESGTVRERRPLTRFVFAHDAGAAIQGPARVDLFEGSGEDAGIVAGSMNETGELFVLLCRDRPATRQRSAIRWSRWRRH